MQGGSILQQDESHEIASRNASSRPDTLPADQPQRQPAEGDPTTAPSTPSQKWEVAVNADQAITIKQGSLCVDNNFMVEPPPS